MTGRRREAEAVPPSPSETRKEMAKRPPEVGVKVAEGPVRVVRGVPSGFEMVQV